MQPCTAIIARGARKGQPCGCASARRFLRGWRCAAHAASAGPACVAQGALVHFGLADGASSGPTLAELAQAQAEQRAGPELAPDPDGERVLARLDGYMNVEVPAACGLPRLPLVLYEPAQASDPCGPRLPLTRDFVARKLGEAAAYMLSRPDAYDVAGALPLDSVRLVGLEYDRVRGLWCAALRP